MNPFREMVLLPLESYKKMRTNILLQNESTPLQKDLLNIKQQYNNVAPDQRMLLESEVISKHTSNNIPVDSNVEQLPKSFDNTIIKDSIEGFAKTQRNRAVQLYNYLESTFVNNPQWNEKGELLSNDEPLVGSNIVDLINFVTATKLRKNTPKDMRQFIDLLVTSNTPSFYFSTKGQEFLHRYKQVADTKQPDDDGDWTEI